MKKILFIMAVTLLSVVTAKTQQDYTHITTGVTICNGTILGPMFLENDVVVPHKFFKITGNVSFSQWDANSTAVRILGSGYVEYKLVVYYSTHTETYITKGTISNCGNSGGSGGDEDGPMVPEP